MSIPIVACKAGGDDAKQGFVGECGSGLYLLVRRLVLGKGNLEIDCVCAQRGDVGVKNSGAVVLYDRMAFARGKPLAYSQSGGIQRSLHVVANAHEVCGVNRNHAGQKQGDEHQSRDHGEIPTLVFPEAQDGQLRRTAKNPRLKPAGFRDPVLHFGPRRRLCSQLMKWKVVLAPTSIFLTVGHEAG